MRTELVEALVKLADDVPAARAALGLSPEAGRRDRPQRRALDQPHPAGAAPLHRRPLRRPRRRARMTRAQRARAGRRLAVGSALFGLVARRRPDPGLPAVGRLGAARAARPCARCGSRRSPPSWPAIDELVVDLRSGSYAALAPVPGAVTVRGAQRAPGRHPRRWSATSTRRTRAGWPGCWPPTTGGAGRRRAAPGTAEAGGVARGT